MKWRALVGWGITIYAVVFLAWSTLVIHGIVDGVLPRILLAMALIAVTLVAARNLDLYHWYDILPHSIGWALIAALLDLICAVPVLGWGLWSDWNVWAGYALIIFVPLAVPTGRHHHEPAHIS